MPKDVTCVQVANYQPVGATRYRSHSIHKMKGDSDETRFNFRSNVGACNSVGP